MSAEIVAKKLKELAEQTKKWARGETIHYKNMDPRTYYRHKLAILISGLVKQHVFSLHELADIIASCLPDKELELFRDEMVGALETKSEEDKIPF